jgi:hypothetical protein
VICGIDITLSHKRVEYLPLLKKAQHIIIFILLMVKLILAAQNYYYLKGDETIE